MSGYFENKEFRCTLANFFGENNDVLKLDKDKQLNLLKSRLGIKYNLRVIKVTSGYIEVSKVLADRFCEIYNYFKLATVSQGDVVKGKIEAVQRKTLAVNVCGVTAVIDKNEIDYNSYNHLNERFKVGETIDVVVTSLKLDPLRKRVKSLEVSRKQAIHNTYLNGLRKYSVGDIVYGRVSYLREYYMEVLLDNKVSVSVNLSRSQYNLNLTDPVVVSIESIDRENLKLFGKLVWIINKAAV